MREGSVNLLVKVACFPKKINIFFQFIKELILTTYRGSFSKTSVLQPICRRRLKDYCDFAEIVCCFTLKLQQYFTKVSVSLSPLKKFEESDLTVV